MYKSNLRSINLLVIPGFRESEAMHEMMEEHLAGVGLLLVDVCGCGAVTLPLAIAGVGGSRALSYRRFVRCY